MSSVCSCCGLKIEGLSRYFMYRVPEKFKFWRNRLSWDSDYTCRHENKHHFISCEIELPFLNSPEESPLGFIVWVEVEPRAYAQYLHYRRREAQLPAYEAMVAGRLATPFPTLPSALDTAVEFKVLSGDPTPYIRAIAPGTALEALTRSGATHAFWHAAAREFAGP